MSEPAAATMDPKEQAADGADVDQATADILTIENRMDLVRSFACEILMEEELAKLLANKPNPTAYDGFEPSGRMHIAQGVMKCLNVNKLTKCGVKFKFWCASNCKNSHNHLPPPYDPLPQNCRVADWFAQLNNKMGGDLKKIRVVGEYMIEVWKAVGMNLDMVEFLWASDEINARPAEYWSLVMDIAIKFKLARIMRCTQIMGRDDSDLQASQIFYPCMQCADIFFLKADICQLGNDQRKVNMLAREYCDLTKRKLKPIIVSHAMLPGLKEGQEKMSKSDPDSAIFMEDSAADVKTKIKKAFCPPGVVEGNPCLEYVRAIVLPWCGKLEVSRPEDNGGNVVYTDMETLEADYASGALHPGDLKPGLTAALNSILQPVRDHFVNDKNAAALLKRVKQFKITR